jgi:hypothetical protein
MTSVEVKKLSNNIIDDILDSYFYSVEKKELKFDFSKRSLYTNKISKLITDKLNESVKKEEDKAVEVTIVKENASLEGNNQFGPELCLTVTRSLNTFDISNSKNTNTAKIIVSAKEIVDIVNHYFSKNVIKVNKKLIDSIKSYYYKYVVASYSLATGSIKEDKCYLCYVSYDLDKCEDSNLKNSLKVGEIVIVTLSPSNKSFFRVYSKDRVNIAKISDCGFLNKILVEQDTQNIYD